MCGVVSPSTGPTMNATTPRTAMKNRAAPRAAPGPIQIRAATSATPAANASMIGSRTSANCGTPKSNSAWKVESPISRPPIANARR